MVKLTFRAFLNSAQSIVMLFVFIASQYMLLQSQSCEYIGEISNLEAGVSLHDFSG